MRYTTRLSLLCLLLSMTTALSAQNYKVIGTATDSTDMPLIGASVVLLNPSDSVLVSFGLSNDEGRFQINSVPEGQYDMQITYIGYGTFSNLVDIQGPDKTIDLGTIKLGEDSQQLDEVVVKASFIPITINKDTVEYNAAAFKVKPNANVEDLLKKMPGIEVEDDGSIKAQGEDVTTVTVDGKKFFGDDPQMATKNLPADAVKKVQVFDKKSKKAEFTGVDDGNTTKSINLELKEDKKQGVFGDVDLAYGTLDRYEGKANINRFGGKTQVSFLGNLNNINNNYYSFSPRGGRRQTFSSASNSPGLNTAGNAGLDISYNFTPDTELSFSYNIGGSAKDEISKTTSENFNLDSYFTTLEDLNENSDNLDHSFDLELETEIDSTHRFEIETDLDIDRGKADVTEAATTSLATGAVQNVVSQTENTNNDAIDVALEAEYGYRFKKKGRNMTLGVDYGKATETENILLDQRSEIMQDAGPSIFNRILQDQIDDQDDDSYEVRLSYTEPLGNRTYLDLTARRNNVSSTNTRNFYDLDPNDTAQRLLNTDLSNYFDNSYTHHFLGTSVQKNTDAYRLNVGLDYKTSNITGELPNAPRVDNDFKFILPSARISFEKIRLRLAYSTSTTLPSTVQLCPIVDNTNPNNRYIGNPNLKPSYTHRVSARLFHWDSFNFRSFFGNISYQYTTDPIVNAQVITDNLVRRTQPLNVDHQGVLSGNFSFSTPINPLHIKTRLSLGGSWTDGINFINGISNNATTTSQNIAINFENLDTEVISTRLSAKYTLGQNRYDISDAQNSQFLNQAYGLDLTIDFGKGWVWDNAFSHNIFSQEAFGENTSFSLWNASLIKQIIDDRLSLKLTAFDLLGQNRGIYRSNSVSSISETISNTLERYFMLGVNYKLSSLGGQDKVFIVH